MPYNPCRRGSFPLFATITNANYLLWNHWSELNTSSKGCKHGYFFCSPEPNVSFCDWFLSGAPKRFNDISS